MLMLCHFSVSTALEQACHSVIMVRPASFGFNADTASNNPYQHGDLPLTEEEVNALASAEFDAFVEKLRAEGVRVHVLHDTLDPHTPDSIFPNNWISLHHDGTVITYPMFGENRRRERELPVFELLNEHYRVAHHVDLETFEQEERYLEGTGSIVFDHINRVAYACSSERTDKGLFKHVCDLLEYQGMLFDAADQNGNAIYHTNIMLFIGTDVAVVCSDAISDRAQCTTVLQALAKGGREVVEITQVQLDSFCGNLLEVQNREGDRIIAMSERAFSSFTEAQLHTFAKHAIVVSAPIDLIEVVGGGSARCMLLGNHLPIEVD